MIKISIIERHLQIRGKESEFTKVFAMFDSGSSYTLVRSSKLKDVIPYRIRNINIPIEVGNGQFIHLKKEALMEIKMNNQVYTFFVKIIDELPEEMIIGVDFLQRFGHTLEFKKDKVRAKSMNLKTHRGNYRL